MRTAAESAPLSAEERKAEQDEIDEKESPEERASFLSRLFFCWLVPPILKGSRNPLTDEDVFPLRHEWSSEHLEPRWAQEWQRSLQDTAKRKAAQTQREPNTKKESKVDDLPSIILPLLRMFRWKIISVTGMRFFSDFVHFANPVMLKWLIDFVSDETSPITCGLGIAVAMFALSEIRSLLINHFFTVMITTSVQVQTVLTNAIYAKALRLSATARNSRSVGAIVNLMSIDVEKMCQTMSITQHYWSSPLQLTLAMSLLWWTIGPPAIAGIAVMLFMIPINYCSSVYIKNWQVKQMKVKDERTNMCNEVLNGIKLIKLYAWEEAFEKRINDLRKQEVNYLRRSGQLGRLVDAANAAAPFIVAVASFSLFVLSDDENVLTPQIAFVCLALFDKIRLPMRKAAMLINLTVQAIVSNHRLKEFMASEERVCIDYETPSEGNAIELKDATFEVDSGQSESAGYSFIARTGSLTAIIGWVASGKSSLLSALMGEMKLQHGSIALTGRIAYVPQEAWLIDGTVRDNVLFGKDYDEQLYTQITAACELRDDFSILPYGDLTPVGEKGASLSGGQKARISLARALYQECDIYLLDDPLSSVDAHVSEAIYRQVLSSETGILKDRTRLLVTHNLQHTKQADTILVLQGGKILQQGAYNDLNHDPSMFPYLPQTERTVERRTSGSAYFEENGDEGEEAVPRLSARSRSDDSRRSGGMRKAEVSLLPERNVEAVGEGEVDVWCSLIRAATLKFCIPFIACYIVHFAFQIARSLCLSNWADASKNITVNNTDDVHKRLSVYTALGLMEVITICGGFHFFVLACQQVSVNLHGPLLRAIFRAPLQFFDVTPIGRILNRLSRELDVIDVIIPINVKNLVNYFLQVISIVLVISYSTPLFIVAVFPLAALYILLLKLFLPTARQVRRLETSARSPILSSFAESLHGVTSIRAYDKVEASRSAFAVHVDNFAKTRYFLVVVNRWLTIYLELFGNFVVFFAALFAVISSRYFSASPGLIGLSVSYALSVTEVMNMVIRTLSDMETNAVSVERVQDYTKTESEAPWHSAAPPPQDWPVEPSINLSKLSLRYRSSLPLVLHHIDAEIRAGEKIAIVGRTGSGKSSLTLALFRMIEPTVGAISLDDIDTSRIGLHELRRKIAIIPQEPVIFSGSLRFNLDPFSQYSDEQLWRTLELCQLKDFTSSLPGKLYYSIAEGGKNISAGQKQLLCLARVLLRKAKVLVLDEATASVDAVTDSLVQSVISNQFRGATVITIAHRLNTISGYDRIMVLDKGRVVEYDKPSRLLSNRNSHYSRLLEKSSENRRVL